MRARTVAGVVALQCAVAATAWTQPVTTGEPRQPESGYIGQTIPELEVDKCKGPPDGTTPADRTRIGEEHYHRGETLYTQGDYQGAVLELVSSYCLVGYYTILKDVGQAYERDLQYEQAIAYFERYVRDMPETAKRASACAPEPAVDRENVRGRIEVLRRLHASVLTETEPAGAAVTVQNDSGIAARAVSGEQIFLQSGTYEMVVEHAGYESKRRTITVEIGKPYTYFFALPRLTGRLSVQVTPPDARLFLGDRFVGVGRVDMPVEANEYVLVVEAPGRTTVQRHIAVISGQVNNLHVELEAKPQFGRKQLIAASAFGGSVAFGLLSAAANEAQVTALAAAGGLGGGLLASYLALPEHVPLAASNLAITSALVGGFAGGAAALLATSNPKVWLPISGAGILVGGAVGYYVGERTKISTGDAAIVNTGALWGTVTASLLTASFGTSGTVSAGLVLSGAGMGTIGGVLIAGYFDVRRTHAALIDAGGVVGMIGGLAAERLAFGASDGTNSDRSTEHVADFTLGGLAVGLIGAAVLTRNLDTAKLPVAPTLGATTDAVGSSTLTYGLGGQW